MVPAITDSGERVFLKSLSFLLIELADQITEGGGAVAGH
jgi:hypothetical protein